MKKILSILFCLCMVVSLLSSTAAASSFPDVPDNAAYAEAAEYLNDAGIMQGDSSGNFNPNKNVTRAQMAAILCRMMGETGSAKNGNIFSDVPTTYWANDTIVKAAELGIISGYSDGTFRPNNAVTYEQAITMVVRAMQLDEIAIEDGGYPDGYINTANEYGFLNNLTAKKREEMSRGQIAVMIFNTRV